jgi:hypothetical protein
MVGKEGVPVCLEKSNKTEINRRISPENGYSVFISILKSFIKMREGKILLIV